MSPYLEPKLPDAGHDSHSECKRTPQVQSVAYVEYYFVLYIVFITYKNVCVAKNMNKTKTK